MDVQVRDRLPGGCAIIDADVEAVWRVRCGPQRLARCLEQVHQCLALRPVKVEKTPDMPTRDDQRVPWRDRKAVPDHDAVRIVGPDT